jgi:hypothetical protein
MRHYVFYSVVRENYTKVFGRGDRRGKACELPPHPMQQIENIELIGKTLLIWANFPNFPTAQGQTLHFWTLTRTKQ